MSPMMLRALLLGIAAVLVVILLTGIGVMLRRMRQGQVQRARRGKAARRRVDSTVERVLMLAGYLAHPIPRVRTEALELLASAEKINPRFSTQLALLLLDDDRAVRGKAARLTWSGDRAPEVVRGRSPRSSPRTWSWSRSSPTWSRPTHRTGVADLGSVDAIGGRLGASAFRTAADAVTVARGADAGRDLAGRRG